jgi:hypothetical protein
MVALSTMTPPNATEYLRGISLMTGDYDTLHVGTLTIAEIAGWAIDKPAAPPSALDGLFSVRAPSFADFVSGVTPRAVSFKYSPNAVLPINFTTGPYND